MTGLIPKNTKSENKIFNSITQQRVMGFILTLAIGKIFSSIMPEKLSLFFIAFCGIEFIVLTMRSPINPTKKFYQSLIDYIGFKSQPVLQYGVCSEEYQNYLKSQRERSEKSNDKKESAYDVAKAKRQAKFEYRQRKKQAKLEAKQAYRERIKTNSD